MLFRRTRAERALMVVLDRGADAGQVQALLDAGARVGTVLPPDGGSFLSLAAVWGDVPVGRVLLDSGADPDGNALRRHIPLHTACYNTHVAFTRLLLEAGADVNAVGPSGKTALFSALASGTSRHSRIPELLLDAGADLSVRDGQGRTAKEDYLHSAHRLLAVAESVPAYSAGRQSILDGITRVHALLG